MLKNNQEDTENVNPNQSSNNQSLSEKAMLKIIKMMQARMDALTTQLASKNITAPTNPTTLTN